VEYISINGKRKLSGSVQINGAKNAAVAIIPAAIAAGGKCVIENLPHVEDVTTLTHAIEHLGGSCRFPDEHTLEIDSGGINQYTVPYDLAKKMRASYYMLGALLGRFKKAEVPLPGGCSLGVRPINYHLRGFEQLGAKIHTEHGIVKAAADKLTGANIYLEFPSVGATINIMIAAVFAEGVTQIENAAKEPHVVDTANFLNKLGANIKGAGTDNIRITGTDGLNGGDYSIIPDQIEAGTYMIAAAITGGDVTVERIIPKHMDSLTAKLEEMQCETEIRDDSIRIKAEKPLHAVNFKAMVYPGFPTDLQPQAAALLSVSSGSGIITETVHEQRFQYVEELRRLGANINVEGRAAFVNGGAELTGAQVNATDLRAGAALVVAGLAAKGETVIGNVMHLDRGYEHLESKLAALGADVKRISHPDEYDA